MTHYADMTSCKYLPLSENLPFLAVGWLEPGHEFLQKPVSERFFERLCLLQKDPWSPPFVDCGVHECGFCQFSGGGSASYRGTQFNAITHGYLFIPADGLLLVAPLSIAHYVDAHSYYPPEQFQQAVLDCPDMRSMAYLKALLACGGREWLRRFEEHV